MTRISIAQALEVIEEARTWLENAYWEANSIDSKDHIFNLLQLLDSELIELMKLSVQDHHYQYQPISCAPSVLYGFSQEFAEQSEQWVPRTKTRDQLHIIIPKLVQAFKAN